MRRLNFRHLHYLRTVIETGGVRAAATALHLTPQTVSAQLKLLEEALGAPLLTRSGRGVQPTEAGQVALQYAQEIFALGQELVEVLQERSPQRPLEFRVGVLDSIPKSIAHWLLEPAMALPERVRISCHEKSFGTLLADLAVHKLDLVVADAPYPLGLNVKCFNHALGATSMACFGTGALAGEHRGKFPQRLHDAPVLLPREDAAWRRELFAWLQKQEVLPWIRGEFDDTALMKEFGRAGSGFFFAPSVNADEICRQYDLQCIGTIDAVKQEFYAISVERRITHPAVRIIAEHARGAFARRAQSATK